MPRTPNPENAEKNDESLSLTTWGTLVIILAILGVIVSPPIFTYFQRGYSFMETGPLGDTIGGLTAPVIGLASSVLVYLALRSQVEANRLIQQQIQAQQTAETEKNEFDAAFRLYQEVHRSLRDLKSYELGGDLEGAEALQSEMRRLAQRTCPVHPTGDAPPTIRQEGIWATIALFRVLVTRAKSETLSEVDRETLSLLVTQLFFSTLRSAGRVKCPGCQSFHAYDDELNQLLGEIQAGVYAFPYPEIVGTFGRPPTYWPRPTA